jgi:hypothetical protein
MISPTQEQHHRKGLVMLRADLIMAGLRRKSMAAAGPSNYLMNSPDNEDGLNAMEGNKEDDEGQMEGDRKGAGGQMEVDREDAKGQIESDREDAESQMEGDAR